MSALVLSGISDLRFEISEGGGIAVGGGVPTLPARKFSPKRRLAMELNSNSTQSCFTASSLIGWSLSFSRSRSHGDSQLIVARRFERSALSRWSSRDSLSLPLSS